MNDRHTFCAYAKNFTWLFKFCLLVKVVVLTSYTVIFVIPYRPLPFFRFFVAECSAVLFCGLRFNPSSIHPSDNAVLIVVDVCCECVCGRVVHFVARCCCVVFVCVRPLPVLLVFLLPTRAHFC